MNSISALLKSPEVIHAIASFCENNHILRLALFGSVLRDDFDYDSDIDVLVEFEAEYTPDFFKLYQMEQELSKLFDGHSIDLVTYRALNPRLREQIERAAVIRYER